MSESIEPVCVAERHLGVEEITDARAPIPEALRGVPRHPRRSELEALVPKHLQVSLVGVPAFGHEGSRSPRLGNAENGPGG